MSFLLHPRCRVGTKELSRAVFLLTYQAWTTKHGPNFAIPVRSDPLKAQRFVIESCSAGEFAVWSASGFPLRAFLSKPCSFFHGHGSEICQMHIPLHRLYMLKQSLHDDWEVHHWGWCRQHDVFWQLAKQNLTQSTSRESARRRLHANLHLSVSEQLGKTPVLTSLSMPRRLEGHAHPHTTPGY